MKKTIVLLVVMSLLLIGCANDSSYSFEAKKLAIHIVNDIEDACKLNEATLGSNTICETSWQKRYLINDKITFFKSSVYDCWCQKSTVKQVGTNGIQTIRGDITGFDLNVPTKQALRDSWYKMATTTGAIIGEDLILEF